VFGGEIKELRMLHGAFCYLSVNRERKVMRLLILAGALLLTGTLLVIVGPSPAQAADVGIWRKPSVATIYRPIPRSPAASLIWARDACWRGCGMDCGRHFQLCLAADTYENCIAQNDACDRFCQRECRFYGGPLLPID
jgi:hypothetical protein